MSQTLRRYKSKYGEPSKWSRPETMSVTAFVGENGEKALQFTIGMNYCSLNEDDVRDLVDVLQKRLNGTYTATGSEVPENEIDR